MFDRLFDLLLHAKAGAVAAVFLVGTTGALVTATVSNGVTTFTVTQAQETPSASPSGSASPSISPSTLPNQAGTTTATPTATASGSANPCSAQARAAADEVQKVNRAFAKFHTELEKRRKDAKTEAARQIIEDADKQLKVLRQNAVKDIHDANTCAGKHDDDEDENEQDEDNDSESSEHSNAVAALLRNLTRFFGGNTTVTGVTTSASGDVQTIADNAVAAMKLVFDTAVSQLGALPTASPRPTRTAGPLHTNSSGKGKSGEHSSHGDND